MRIRAITFDCFGSLVDLRAGVLEFVTPLLARPTASRYQQEEARPSVTPAAWLARWLQIHDKMLRPWRPWGDVLARSFDATMQQLGFEAFVDEGPSLTRSIAAWPLVADAKVALRRLSRGRQLGLVVNADTTLLGDVVGRLQAPFSTLLGADEVRAYKPDPALFVECLRRLGLSPTEILHVAVDEHTDLAPARSLGIRTARIGDGAAGADEVCVASLTALADWLAVG